MGLDSLNLDRATVEGPPLASIVAPRRMSEILIPGTLPPRRLVPTERDIVLTAPEDAAGPLRCTISCMAKSEYRRILEATEVPFVDTSAWECTDALENESHVWTWTLRASRYDEHVSDRVVMMLLGPVKWARSQQETLV